MATKKSRYRVHNGGNTNTESDYDTIHYETSEDMIVNQVQALSRTGYRKVSGGLLYQWGTSAIVNSAYSAELTIKFPITANEILAVIPATEDATTALSITTKNIGKSSFTVKVTACAQASGTSVGIGAVRINYFAVCR